MVDPGAQPESRLRAEQWVDQHGDTLFRYALSRLRDSEAAEEVVQETFVAAWGARHQYSGQGSEGAWLLGICKRKVIDHVRYRNRPDAAVGDDSGGDPSASLFDSKGNWRVDPRIIKGRPEAALEREEFWQAFRSCLDGLPQRQSAVFTLREVDEMSSPEICKELGITPSNLWVLLHRARLLLSALYEMRTLKSGGHADMLRCREISELVSQSMEHDLPWHQRMQIWMHLAMCRLCAGFARQLRLLRRAAHDHAERLSADPSEAPPVLSQDARERIRAALRDGAT